MPKKASVCDSKKASKKGSVVVKTLSGLAAEIPLTPKPSNEITTQIVVDANSVDSEGNVIEWLPKYQTAGAACVDLRANIPADVQGSREINLPYRVGQVIDCGIKVSVPENFKAEIVARSGWACKGLVVTNAPGQIDSDFRATLKVIVCNIGKEIIKIKHGDRIAQMYLTPVYKFLWDVVEELDQTERGEGGLGSTGVK